MIIDCDSCVMRNSDACGDCVVSVLLGDDGPLSVDSAERDALSALGDAGLVPRLRLVVGDEEGWQAASGA